MAQKIFLELSGTKLQSDERDIMVPMADRFIIEKWCQDNNIQAQQVYHQLGVQHLLGVMLWRIPDEQQRAWFALRWS